MILFKYLKHGANILWCILICYIWQDAWIVSQALEGLCKLGNNYLGVSTLDCVKHCSSWHQQSSCNLVHIHTRTRSSDPHVLRWLNRPPTSSRSEVSEDYARKELSRMHMTYIDTFQIQRSFLSTYVQVAVQELTLFLLHLILLSILQDL